MTDFFDGSAFKAKVALEALKEEQRLLEFGLGFEVYLSLETAIKGKRLH